jgi:hypothetical protein
MKLFNRLTLHELKPKLANESIPLKCVDVSDDKKFAYLWL